MKKHIYILLIFILSLSRNSSFSQNPNIDSLKKALVLSKEDTNKVKILNEIAWELKSLNTDTAIIFSNQALKLSQKIKWIKGIGQSEHRIGSFFFFKGDYIPAIDHYQKALIIWEELIKSSDNATSVYSKISKGKTIGNIGSVYRKQGNLTKALESYFKALRIAEELKDKSGVAVKLGNIGNIYSAQGNYSKALEYYFQSLKINKELGIKKSIAEDLGNIAIVYDYQAEYQKALQYYTESMKMKEELGDQNGVATDLGNIGSLHQEQKEYTEALDCYLKALKIKEELGDKSGTAINLGNIGELYNKTGNLKESEKYFKRSLSILYEIGSLDIAKDFEKDLSLMYEKTGQSNLAFVHFKKYIAARDTVNSEENQKEQVRSELNYDFEKKELAAKADQEKKDAIAGEAKQKQKLILYFVVGVLVLIIAFFVFLYNRFKITQRQKAIIETQKQKVDEAYEELHQQNEEIASQRDEIENQKHLIEEHQKDMIDSITYAKRIQDAILPPIELIKEKLPNSFVLYKPKDIVAGDFFWFETIGNTILIAAADCTGHGVPGAMVSVVCSNALNRAVKEFQLTEPGEILDKVRELVIETFVKSNQDVKDGMDISLLSIESLGSDQKTINNRQNTIIKWSGANNPLWYFNDNGLNEITADKQPIGKTDNPKPFTTHTISLPRGEGQGGDTTFYLFTDGYADQFGGPKGKKFKYKQFQKKIFASLDMELSTQHSELDTVFENWKGDLEQVDDVCVIGIRL